MNGRGGRRIQMRIDAVPRRRTQLVKECVMTEQELWKAYIASGGLDDGYEAWAFGTDADQLARLVLLGEKTATSSA